MFPGSNDKQNKSPFMVKTMTPVDDDEDEDEESNGLDKSNNANGLSARHDSASSTRAGSLELRLRPTMTSEARPSTAISGKTKASSMHSGEGHHFRLFPSSSKQAAGSRGSLKTLGKKASIESLQSSIGSKPTLGRSSTNMSNQDIQSMNGDVKPKARFQLHRNKSKEKPSDDLTQMMSRASNYMTLAYVKIPSVVLCLSYKGKGERNIEDVHDFVFRLPEIEYRNKTWSNLDLALALKKDVIRALISHTGAIIGNKFSKHRPNTAQQHRLRELATSSMLLAPSSQDNSHDNSDASIKGGSPTTFGKSDRSTSPRQSFSSSRNGLTRTPSDSSSIVSFQGPGRVNSVPSSLAMTPSSQQSNRPVSSHNRPETSYSHPDSSYEHESSVSKSIRNGNEGGVLANTLGRLKQLKERQNTSSPSSTDVHVEEEGGEKRRKSIKKILGALN
jgi:hypothetical protein